MSVFSERLLKLRTEKQLSQIAIASAVNVTVRTYQRYEYGEREPQISELIKLAQYFGVSSDYLLGLSNQR